MNAALVRRKYFRSLIADVLVVILCLLVWFGAQELSTVRTNWPGCIRERRITVTEQFDFARNWNLMENDVFAFFVNMRYNGGISYNRKLPFDGITYTFVEESGRVAYNPVTGTHDWVDETVVTSVDMGRILTILFLSFSAIVICQTLHAIFCTLAGSRLIRKYLKPIDDVAMMAERLSSEGERHTADGDEIRRAGRRHAEKMDDAEQGESGEASPVPTTDYEEAIHGLTDAIDGIDDTDDRLHLPHTELEGLEAAVNNMLRRLEEGKRRQIRFVDDASHELRTPISVIQGYANMLDRWGKEDPKVRDEAIAAIKSESEHMRTLIDQLLFLARGEMDRHVFESRPLNACEILREILDESRMLDAKHEYVLHLPTRKMALPAGTEANPPAKTIAESSENAVRILESTDFAPIPDADATANAEPGEIPPVSQIPTPHGAPTPTDDWEYVEEEPLPIYGDPAMIKQSIRILRDNAIKYTPDGGVITFRGTAKNGEIVMEVSDTGIGISANELPRIFDRFYRGSNVRGDNAGGSGLGLSIAKWIITEHGGRIEAISSPGIGTRMTVVMKEHEE